jgi:hypothetical protein
VDVRRRGRREEREREREREAVFISTKTFPNLLTHCRSFLSPVAETKPYWVATTPFGTSQPPSPAPGTYIPFESLFQKMPGLVHTRDVENIAQSRRISAPHGWSMFPFSTFFVDLCVQQTSMVL